MPLTNFYLQKESTQNFEETINLLKKEIENNKFKILHIHDVQATFANKNIEHGPYKIMEFCRASVAKKILDTEPLIGLFLPCKIVIYEKDDRIIVAALLPNIIKTLFPKTDTGDFPAKIQEDITLILNCIK